MKKTFVFWVFLTFCALSLAVAITAMISETIDWQDHGAPARDSLRLPMPLATYVYRPFPFYYPFRARPTALSGIQPFSSDALTLGRHNSHGFRTPEYTIAHPPNTFRIVIIGDSFTYGPGVFQEETYSYLLSRLLNQRCQNFHSEVIALAVSGHRLSDKWIELLAHGQSLKPELVIFQISASDLDFFEYYNILASQGVPNLFDQLSKKETQAETDASIDFQVFSESLDGISKWSAAHSTPVIFLGAPPLDNSRTGGNFHHYDPGTVSNISLIQRFDRLVQKISTLGFPLLNLEETFREKAGDQPLSISENQNNPNAYAHRLTAENVLSFLFDHNLLACSMKQLPPADPTWQAENVLIQEVSRKWEVFSSNYSKQQVFFEALLKLYPHAPWVINATANLYVAEKRWREATNAYSSLLQFAPAIAAPWYHLGITSGNNYGRIHHFERMISMVPDHTPSLQSLSLLYLYQERYPEACQILSHLVEIPPNHYVFEHSMQQMKDNHCDSIQANAHSIH